MFVFSLLFAQYVCLKRKRFNKLFKFSKFTEFEPTLAIFIRLYCFYLRINNYKYL